MISYIVHSFGNIPYWRCEIGSSIIIIFNISIKVCDGVFSN